MRSHLLSKILFCTLLCLGLLGLKGAAFAQVYKSYDADGNVIFSDKPSKRSMEVEITKPNLSDAFEKPPPPARPPVQTKPEAESEPEPVTQPIADDDSADTNNDGRVSRREKEEQRKKRREKAKKAEGYKD